MKNQQIHGKKYILFSLIAHENEPLQLLKSMYKTINAIVCTLNCDIYTILVLILIYTFQQWCVSVCVCHCLSISKKKIHIYFIVCDVDWYCIYCIHLRNAIENCLIHRKKKEHLQPFFLRLLIVPQWVMFVVQVFYREIQMSFRESHIPYDLLG